MDIDAQSHTVAAAVTAQCTQEVRRRKHLLQGGSPPISISVSRSLHATAPAAAGRPTKRPFPEAFPYQGDFVPRSPYEKRHTFPFSTPPSDPRYAAQADPPVPIHSAGAAPPVSYPSSLPYASPLSTGFGSTPELAGYNIHPHLNHFPGNLSPVATQSYDPSSLNHHSVVASSLNGTAGGFLPSVSYNNTSPATPSHPQPQQQPQPSASVATADHSQDHQASGGSNSGSSMTRHAIPNGQLMPGPSHPFSGSSYHQDTQTRTSSTTIMHHEGRTGFHVPQYYNPYDSEPQLEMHQVAHDPSPTSAVETLGVEKEWDMVPDAPRYGGIMPPVPEYSSPASAEEDTVMDGGGGGDGSGANQLEKRGSKMRSKFDEEKLVETNMTRRLKACVRCRMQRIRCQRDPDDRDGTCQTCNRVSQNSKKVIHKIPCLRYKLTETVLYREGGLQLTKRWESHSLQIHNIGDWVTSEIRTIELTLGICDEPIQLKVRKFAPKDGDVVHRHWVDGTVKKKKELQPYALADVATAAKDFQDYIKTHCIDGFLKGVSNKEPLIKRTYEMAVKHYRNLLLMEDSEMGRRENPEIKFLFDLFRLVFAMRHTCGSSWICGKEKLEMEPETKDHTYPLFNKVSTPRMIIAQFDSINALKVLQPLRGKLLTRLEEWVSSNKPTYWFTIYLSYFILLHEVSLTCEDRYRHAIANSAGMRYTIPNFVTDLQYGANVMLAHWQYYKKDIDPLNLDIRNREKSQLNFLSAEQLMFILQSYREASKLENEFQYVWDVDFWEHPYFYISQMFELGWSPRRIWTINYPGPSPRRDLERY